MSAYKNSQDLTYQISIYIPSLLFLLLLTALRFKVLKLKAIENLNLKSGNNLSQTIIYNHQ